MANRFYMQDGLNIYLAIKRIKALSIAILKF